MTDEIHDLVHDTVDKILSGFCGKVAWASFDDDGISTDHWMTLEQLGILKAGLSEDHGGASLDLPKIMNLVGLSGYHACPLPLAETLVGYWIAETVGMDIDEGSIITFADDALCDPPYLLENGSLNGQVIRVPYGNEASHIFVKCKDHENHNTLVCIKRTDIKAMPKIVKNIAGTPSASFQLAGTSIMAAQLINDETALPNLRLIGALMRSHQMAGAMKRAVELTATYVMERKQFGRPIGKFQAVQQMIAVAAEHTVSSETIARAASHTAVGKEASLLIASAKSWVSESVQVVTDACHQSHGAMGFTHEYPLHYFTRRLWSWREEFGSEYEWQTNIGLMALEAGSEHLWAMISGDTHGQVENPLPTSAAATIEVR